MIDQAQEVTLSADVTLWLDLIEDAQKDMRDYTRRCDKIDKRYRYEAAQKTNRRKFQMLVGQAGNPAARHLCPPAEP